MKCNVGKGEAIGRAIAGIAIVAAGIYFKNWWGTLGLILLVTAAIRWCPVTRLLGINTCGTSSTKG